MKENFSSCCFISMDVGNEFYTGDANAWFWCSAYL